MFVFFRTVLFILTGAIALIVLLSYRFNNLAQWPLAVLLFVAVPVFAMYLGWKHRL
ncbi:hypothetical protein [Alteribacillus bidgolensis]|uniref:Uncharacterized protein n=1 Tax=Alteribacillus bidgolensis TaxID=930129 RepID=A0A1G8J600_9BACI|nr:hypothetical protein [Alteribacillus bidgolensis]SDI26541.1 hypothetical protein SAMN05216352_10654 [Alteribacillus bidgolensis]